MAEECCETEVVGENRKLSEIFDDALTIYEEILKSDEASSSQKLQVQIKKCIKLLEESTNLINIAEIFSSNENIDEVSTANIKFFLIPALLGCLVSKVQSSDRLSMIETAEVYFKDFLKRLQDYEIISAAQIKVLEEHEADTLPKKLDLNQLARERNEKIRKYKEQKEMESELKNMKSKLQSTDDEICRKYYLLYLKNFVNIALDELESIRHEKPLAKHLAETRKGKTLVTEDAKAKVNEQFIMKPLKPVIITRNEMQKKVFGAGYPSLPTMTVDEFYEQRVKEGIFPAHGSNYSKTLQDLADPEIAQLEEEKEEMRKENEVENDDRQALMKKRNMDDFKDDHRRGWGNRMNRS